MKAMKIAVVGSINIDKVCVLDRIPMPGETLKANEYFETFGGKGANQAVAAAKLGANVTMVGCVGIDDEGKRIISNMEKNNVNTEGIMQISEAVTGRAFVDIANHDNAIVIVTGANEYVTIEYIKTCETILEEADIIMLQNEILLATNEYLFLTYGDEKKIIYNPAPFMDVDKKIISKATWITPNKSEAELLLQKKVSECANQNELQKKLIITMGSEGVTYYDENKKQKIPASICHVKDTTGAGDTFNGSLAFCLSQGWSIEKSIQFANVAAGISTESLGAQEGMPNYNQVIERMEK